MGAIAAKMRAFGETHIYMHVDLSRDWWLLMIISICSVAYGIVPAVTSILMGAVFNLLQKPVIQQFDSVNTLMRDLTIRTMAILITGIASIPFCWLSIYAWMSLGERQGFRLRRKLLRSYFEKSMAWYDINEQISGDYTQLNRCVEELRSSSAEASAIIFQNLVTVIALLGTALYYSWSLTLVIMANSPLVIGFAIYCSRNVEKYGKIENSETSVAADIMAWSLNAAKMVRLLGTQDYEIAKFRASVLKCRMNFNKMSLFSSLNYSILRFLTLCMFVQGFWYGNVRIKSGNLKPGDVMTCFSSCILLASTLNSTLHQVVTLQKGAVGLKKIQEFLTSDVVQGKECVVNSVHLPLLWEQAQISFENVSFAYPSRSKHPVIKNLNLKVPGGRFTFIVGKSGSGKSTISNLLLKLYRPCSGSIKVNDVDIKEINQQDLFRSITLVEQNSPLFEDSIKNNIQLTSDEHRDDGRLSQACQAAMLEGVIRDLAKGLDTTIGSSGVDLSGGEQQRVALARAFVRDSPILILDEALSAQDRMHKDLLMEAIRFWRKGRTTIILTHELNDILEDDFVLLMEDGNVIERGQKSDLLSDSTSKFSLLHAFQLCDEIEDEASTITDSNRLSLGAKLEPIRVDVEELYSEMGSPSTEKTYSVLEPEYNRMPSTFVRNSIDLLQSTLIEPHFNRRPAVSKRTHLAGDPTTLEIQDAEKGAQEPKFLGLKSILIKMLTTAPNKGLLIAGIGSSVASGVANPLFSYTFSKLLSGIASGSHPVSAAHNPAKWSLIVLLVAFLDSAFTFLKCYILSRCGENWIKELRINAFRSVMEKDFTWFQDSNNSTSNITSLILNDLRDLRALASEFLAALSTLAVVSLCGLLWALVAGWKLSLVCISLIPMFVLFSGIYGGLLQNYEARYKTCIAELENELYKAIRCMKTIKCLQMENKVARSYEMLEVTSKGAARKRAMGTGFGVASSNALTFITQSILLYFGMKLVITGEYTPGKMLETLTLLLFTIMTCMTLMSQVPEISRGQRAATYLFKLFRNEHEEGASVLKERHTPIIKTCSKQTLISIKHLKFSYSNINNPMVYKNLSLKVDRGEIVGLVGTSGSGKSTLWSLLTRLYPVENGSISIDGTDINQWDRKALRSCIAVVEQKPLFFSGSIIENLTYGLMRKVSDEEVNELLLTLGMLEFVNSTPKRLHSVIDTQLLSGGQVQRLAIARALLRKPQLLVLDECTSALDARHSFIMSEFVKHQLYHTTTLVVTHSEQMMRSCHRILTFNKGEIVEEGSFDNLFNQKGELYRILTCNSR